MQIQVKNKAVTVPLTYLHARLSRFHVPQSQAKNGGKTARNASIPTVLCIVISTKGSSPDGYPYKAHPSSELLEEASVYTLTTVYWFVGQELGFERPHKERILAKAMLFGSLRHVVQSLSIIHEILSFSNTRGIQGRDGSHWLVGWLNTNDPLSRTKPQLLGSFSPSLRGW